MSKVPPPRPATRPAEAPQAAATQPGPTPPARPSRADAASSSQEAPPPRPPPRRKSEVDASAVPVHTPADAASAHPAPAPAARPPPPKRPVSMAVDASKAAAVVAAGADASAPVAAPRPAPAARPAPAPRPGGDAAPHTEPAPAKAPEAARPPPPGRPSAPPKPTDAPAAAHTESKPPPPARPAAAPKPAAAATQAGEPAPVAAAAAPAPAVARPAPRPPPPSKKSTDEVSSASPAIGSPVTTHAEPVKAPAPRPPPPAAKPIGASESKAFSPVAAGAAAEHAAAPGRPAPPAAGGRPPPPKATGSSGSTSSLGSVGSAGSARPPPPAANRPQAPPLPPRPTEGHPLYFYEQPGPRAVCVREYERGAGDEITLRVGDKIVIEGWTNDKWRYGYVVGTSAKGSFPIANVTIIEDISKDIPAPSAVPAVQVMDEAGFAPIPAGEYDEEDPYANETPLPENVAWARAIVDFEGQSEQELSFRAGDRILLEEYVNEEWLRGKHYKNGSHGMFPVVFVEVVNDVVGGDEGLGAPSAGDAPPAYEEPVAAAAPVMAWQLNSYMPKEEAAPPPKEEPKVVEISSGPRARGIETFIGESEEELSFSKGEWIRLTARVNADWLSGDMPDGRAGMFPQSFVEIIEPLAGEALPGAAPVAAAPAAAAAPPPGSRYAQVPQTMERHPLEMAMEMHPLERMMYEDTGRAAAPAKRGLCSATAIFDFDAASDAELSFRVGDTIYITSRVNSDWLAGELATGASGMFPQSFVELEPGASV